MTSPRHVQAAGRASERTSGTVRRRLLDVSTALVSGVCAAVVTALVGLMAWSFLPMLAGWQPTVVLTGSMQPRIAPGDVVLSAPLAPGDVQAGRVLWFTDPDRGITLVHRATQIADDGSITTQGDANQSPDATPITEADVLGLPRLRIPVVGLPVIWAGQQQWHLVAGTVLGLALALRGATLALGGRR